MYICERIMPSLIRFVIIPAALLTVTLITFGGVISGIPPTAVGGWLKFNLQQDAFLPNPPNYRWGPNGSWGMVKVQPSPLCRSIAHQHKPIPVSNCPLADKIRVAQACQGWTLTIPQLPLGGFQKDKSFRCRLDFNHPPTAVGGIETRLYEDSRVSMGCVYTVVVYGHDTARLRMATAAALDEVDRIDRLMSHYKNDSELSLVNREAAKSPVKVDPELFDFIAECLRYSRESEGAFDITVGPLMKAWGFFRGEGRMPGEAELAEARGRVGYGHVILNQKDGTIFFYKAGVEIDLGGIAKGYAVDRAVAVLKQCGVTSALLSAGGSTIYALGAPPGKPAWEIEVQDPVERGRIATRVRLKDRALSVSGSYEKFFELNGARYSHVMDPKTGRPVQGVLSVAVITDDGMSGDALDNVFYVLGVERGRACLNKFSASEVIFFLPDSRKKWKMARIRR